MLREGEESFAGESEEVLLLDGDEEVESAEEGVWETGPVRLPS